MALLLFSIAAGENAADFQELEELFFRPADDGNIELLTAARRHVGLVPDAWRTRIRDTARHKANPHAYVWRKGSVDLQERLLILVATAGSKVENAAKNPAIIAESERLLQGAEPVVQPLIGAWSAHGVPAPAAPLALGGGKTYPVGIVGESHYQSAIKRCRVGQPVSLQPEPSNPFDPEAIAAVSMYGELIGYIGKDSFVRDLVHVQCRAPTATILSLKQSGGGLGVVLEVDVNGSGTLSTRAYRGEDEADPPRKSYFILTGIGIGALLILGYCTGAIH